MTIRIRPHFSEPCSLHHAHASTTTTVAGGNLQLGVCLPSPNQRKQYIQVEVAFAMIRQRLDRVVRCSVRTQARGRGAGLPQPGRPEFVAPEDAVQIAADDPAVDSDGASKLSTVMRSTSRSVYASKSACENTKR
ncbi:hypothetical protein LQG66_25695 [Bradyrhizobium ontarionense]|uniref:Transposase DDE domain-containing protein n=1 Tax=Bradyrhizobium ontarionense TaxID=2898149 RepID=A0ABY3RR20_9BRAD|nr:hypothetical protein [Bradyrhizobium sp. A19]UFZ08654.1 hypothetical protein LQG66_25695 [Bradyrhizobium sp. A19]